MIYPTVYDFPYSLNIMETQEKSRGSWDETCTRWLVDMKTNRIFNCFFFSWNWNRKRDFLYKIRSKRDFDRRHQCKMHRKAATTEAQWYKNRIWFNNSNSKNLQFSRKNRPKLQNCFVENLSLWTIFAVLYHSAFEKLLACYDTFLKKPQSV